MSDDALLGAVQAGGVAFSTVRRLSARAKLPGVADLVDDELDDAEDDKIIVFAHHREVVQGLAERLKRYTPVLIYGATARRTCRERLVSDFPERRDMPALIILARWTRRAK